MWLEADPAPDPAGSAGDAHTEASQAAGALQHKQGWTGRFPGNASTAPLSSASPSPSRSTTKAGIFAAIAHGVTQAHPREVGPVRGDKPARTLFLGPDSPSLSKQPGKQARFTFKTKTRSHKVPPSVPPP